MTSGVTFKVKVQGQALNSIKSSNSDMRELKGLHLGVNRCWDSNETIIDDLRGHLQGQSSKVKPNIPLILAIRLCEIYKSLHLGVNRCCESNETNNDGLRGYTWGTWLVNPLRLDKIILEIILKVKVYGQIQISIFSCKNRLKFVKICILGELDMINQFLLVQMRLEVEFQSQCMMRRHKWLLYL